MALHLKTNDMPDRFECATYRDSNGLKILFRKAFPVLHIAGLRLCGETFPRSRWKRVTARQNGRSFVSARIEIPTAHVIYDEDEPRKLRDHRFRHRLHLDRLFHSRIAAKMKWSRRHRCQQPFEPIESRRNLWPMSKRYG